MRKVAIVTRNAMHGGVETMIALHQRRFAADVYVTGGLEYKDTCPYAYTYIDIADLEAAAARLTAALAGYEVVIYHWPPPWAVEAIAKSGTPSIEVVHRTDTNDCDKRVPTLIATHSQYLADFVTRESGREATVIPHGIDVARFPRAGDGAFVGGITSYYYPVKGLDLFFDAWQKLRGRFPGQAVRFYGAGSGLPEYQRMLVERGLDDVELLGPVAAPEAHIGEFRLSVQPSRIEGMPYATLEALAANVPVVCSDLPGMVEFDEVARRRGVDGLLVLFRSEDADDLARQVERVLRGDAGRADTRSYIARHYGADAHCASYAKAIERAIALAKGGAPQGREGGWLHRLRAALSGPR